MDSNGGGPTPVRLYLNSGTSSQYKFTNYTTLKAGSTEIKHGRCMICVADLNLNGKKDLIVGDNSGRFYFYDNVGTNSSPELSSLGAIKANGSTIKLDGDTRLCVDDWNSDGALDILAGDYYDNQYIIKGIPKVTALNNIPKDLISSNSIKLNNNKLIISSNSNATYNLSILSIRGRELYSANHKLTLGKNIINHNNQNIAPGMYLVKLSSCQTAMLFQVIKK